MAAARGVVVKCLDDLEEQKVSVAGSGSYRSQSSVCASREMKEGEEWVLVPQSQGTELRGRLGADVGSKTHFLGRNNGNCGLGCDTDVMLVARLFLVAFHGAAESLDVSKMC